MNATRRLAAILAADVVGYSRLMGEDEAGTAKAVREHREAATPAVRSHGGRIVKTMGDGVLLEFPSVVAAVECAIAIQKLMTERNESVPEDKRILYRMGVHIGDVIVEGEDILGDGVNIAARLEGIAEAGGICLSASAHEHVQGRIEAGFLDLGEKELKNIARPVRVYAITSGSVTPIFHPPASAIADRGSAVTGRTEVRLALPEKPSIAVLPFQNMSGDPEQEYFVDGIVEDIVTGFSRIKWLFVIARNSSFVYKGRAVDVRQVGRDLGVRYILEGSVRKTANRLRVTGQVVEAESGRHIWAERYDRTLDDIFEVQDELTTSVVGAIVPSLRRAEVERAKRKRPESLDAYDLVLQAQPDVDSGMPDRAAKALLLLERALALDSTYALAHGLAAMSYHNRFLRAGLNENDRLSSIRHARMAITYGQDDALALTFGGFSIGMDGHDRAAAFAAFEAALELSPSTALAYIFGSVIFGWTGEAERAIEWGERGIRLSPFDSWAFAAYGSLVLGHFHRGRFAEAANAAYKAVQSNPEHSINYVLLAAPLAKLGRVEEAKTAAARALELHPAFRYGRQFSSVACPGSLAGLLGQALSAAGLQE